MVARRLALECLAMLALGSAHCEEYGQRVYTARLYRVEAACLEPSVPIGVVQAAELRASCDPQCLSLDGELYVSVVCPPLPVRASTLGPEVPACALALAAHGARSTCDDADAGLDADIDAGRLDAGRLDAGRLD